MSGEQWKPLMSERPHVREMEITGSNPYSGVSGNAEYKRYFILSKHEWGLEMVTSILSLLCLGGIAAIFVYMDDQPLSHWPVYISLNATISILTTALGATMMHSVSAFISQLKWLHFKKRPRTLSNFESFDEASRGVSGSTKFLFKVRWNLASLGALITILRLGLAAFTQQVVEIGDRPVSTPDNNATFGYTHAYYRQMPRELANAGDEAIPQDPKMQAAILQGLYDISTFARFSCTGSCAWNQSVVSLGFKSQCKNVTQVTLDTQRCTGSRESEFNCSMTTPGGLGVVSHSHNTEYATTFYLNATAVVKDQFDSGPGNNSEFARLVVYRASSDHNFASFNHNITECSISLAAYEYSEAKSNGTTFNFEKTREIDLGKSPWKLANSSVFAINESKSEGIPRLEISKPDLRALQNFFESSTIVTEWTEGSRGNENIAVSPALGGTANVTRLMDKMATSMTDYLRSGPNSQTATGQRVEIVTYVTIRWMWFIGPGAIELAALLFAIMTMASNRKSRRVPLWKSSALAVLACRNESGDGLIHSKIKDIKKIEEMAQGTSARLE
ncbi:hypothetical protein N0V84_003175 [Fusarium piperis]|uniref:Uncharacterized protein n=1 Tax=Fusarium piperis TaxID=1435070 RepID=A0A9W8WHX0_9HYPO|nr:hypothetical protein N0V84_003175 [Fusarium piperis]